MNIRHVAQYRQMLYWRLLTSMFGLSEAGRNFETMAAELVEDLNLPALVLDPTIAIDTLLRCYPELEQEFHNLPLATSSPDVNAPQKTPRQSLNV